MKFTIFQGAAIAIAGALAFAAPATAATFSNTTPITIPGSGTFGPGAPYPSAIDVSGSGIISSLTVSLFGLAHTWPDDIDVLLVGPTGANVLLMSDAGWFEDISGVDLTFDDAAAATLPDFGVITSGTYQVSDFVGSSDNFDAPAPAGPYGTALSVFNGLDANGTWSLFIDDAVGGDSGALAGGWALNIETTAPVPLPASLPLLLVGLGAFGAMRRRKRA